MANPVTFSGDMVVIGAAQFSGTVSLPSASVADAQVTGAAGNYVNANKLRRRLVIEAELFAPTTTILAVTSVRHLVRGLTGTLIDIGAVIQVQATGADRTVNVDVQKSTGGGAFATVLSATVAITNVTVIRTRVAGTISTPAVVAGDILEFIVTVAGAAGAQAQGLLATLVMDEDPA